MQMIHETAAKIAISEILGRISGYILELPYLASYLDWRLSGGGTLQGQEAICTMKFLIMTTLYIQRLYLYYKTSPSGHKPRA